MNMKRLLIIFLFIPLLAVGQRQYKYGIKPTTLAEYQEIQKTNDANE